METDVWAPLPPSDFRVAWEELEQLRAERQHLRRLWGFAPDAPLPPEAYCAPRFRTELTLTSSGDGSARVLQLDTRRRKGGSTASMPSRARVIGIPS